MSANNEFPLECLPPLLLEAVQAVALEAQAPLPIVVAAAMSAVSLACQDLIDVDLYQGRAVPCSLYFLTVAESGERKSGVARRFTSAIRSFQREQFEQHKDRIDQYSAAADIHRAQEKGLLREAMKRAENSESTDDLIEPLRKLRQSTPMPPKYAKILYDDATPEALVENLINKWGSAGIISDEAEIVFNARTFSRLQNFNKLWDGDEITFDRKGTGEQILEGARLTISLMTQRSTLQNFLKKKGANARGNGFLARLLFSAPAQGGPKQDIPTYPSPALDRFNQRILELLRQNVSLKSAPGWKRLTIAVSPDAYEVRALFSDAFSRHSHYGSFFSGAQDVTAKLRENATRLAALLTYFSDGHIEIDRHAMDCAGRICFWYLKEFIAFFPPHPSVDPAQADASTLLAYLAPGTKLGPPPWKKNEVLRNGGLRPVSRLDAAVQVLVAGGQLEALDIDGVAHLKPRQIFGHL